MAEIELYSFEPMREHSDSDEDLNDNPDESKRGNTTWCSCERCENWEISKSESACVAEEAVTKISREKTYMYKKYHKHFVWLSIVLFLFVILL